MFFLSYFTTNKKQTSAKTIGEAKRNPTRLCRKQGCSRFFEKSGAALLSASQKKVRACMNPVTRAEVRCITEIGWNVKDGQKLLCFFCGKCKGPP